jgi:glycosyltransferase involved in cell wall biosynthesis
MLIHAFFRISDQYELHIYGDGEERGNLEKLADNNMRIRFFGFIEKEEELAGAFQDAALMVLPSLNEEMPLSIMESLAAGVPVLATSLPSVVSRYQNNIEYINEDDSIDVLAKRITEIVGRENIGVLERGRQFAQGFSWDRHFQKLQEIYSKLSSIF